jgi:phosphoribosylformimino-5-aminoimidazole carboxamide ribonucleotide (ProFAR) isomerase
VTLSICSQLANKKRICHDPIMSVRSCRVTIQNLDGISHTAEVTADTLYEAVAQGLAAFRKNEWVEGVQEQFGVVKVSVADIRVEHQVKMVDFTKWLERPGRTPREVSQRHKIRTILGMSGSRRCHASLPPYGC